VNTIVLKELIQKFLVFYRDLDAIWQEILVTTQNHRFCSALATNAGFITHRRIYVGDLLLNYINFFYGCCRFCMRFCQRLDHMT